MKQEPKISDYAIIGNCRSAALVSKYGSIDWCCLPEFHSPALFSSLLDRGNGGYFKICPVGEYTSSQGYIPDTNVVETVFTTESGQAKLLDTFVVQTEQQKSLSLFPDHEILRIVEMIQGTMQFHLQYLPRIFFGKRPASLRDHKKLGITYSYKENTFTLLTTLESLSVTENKCEAVFKLEQSEKQVFSLSCSTQSPSILPELKTTASVRMGGTIDYWKSWIGQCKYNGLYLEQVKRSALVLKLLTHAPSGAIIAAPTTSLPEELGGSRNWDYRYCWLRDASFTIRVLTKLGFEEEAHAYMNWILHATRLTRPRLQVVYSVFGINQLPEKTLPWLEGFNRSQPVRIGNGAQSQLQLDVYGEVLDAVYSYSKLVDKFDNGSTRFIMGLGKMICKLWNRPDNGIWEVRASPAHYTHSKVMAWVGLDRLIKIAERYSWKNSSVAEFERVKSIIGKTIEDHAFNMNLNAYTSTLNGNKLDASTLVFPLVGYCDAASPRMSSTTKAIKEHLTYNKLLYRYQKETDGLAGGEGAFGISTFWLVENLAKSGKLDEATDIFEHLLDCASPGGLFAEEIHPETRDLLGNYPQSFTHIGLINAALSLNERTEDQINEY